MSTPNLILSPILEHSSISKSAAIAKDNISLPQSIEQFLDKEDIFQSLSNVKNEKKYTQ